MKVRVFPVSIGDESIYSSYYALGVLIAYAKVYKEGVLNEHCVFEKIQPTKPEDTSALIEQLKSYKEPLVLMFSSYIWNYHHNVMFSKEVRKHIPNALCVFGGPQIPRAEKPLKKLMLQLHCIDIAVRGEGEEVFAELLELIGSFSDDDVLRQCDFSSLAGIAYKTNNMNIAYTQSKERTKDLSIFPSPYLTGEYDHLEEMPYLSVLETNRGCPFGCTFCDWGGATLSKVKKFDLDKVFSEIDYLAARKVPRVYVIDANFGIFERDIEVSEKLIEANRRTGYPVWVHQSLAKNSPERVGRIVRLLHGAGIMGDAIVSLQSTDPLVLENIDRKNIKVSAYEDLISVYHDVGMVPTTDILVGLPGQNLDSIKKDLQFCFDRHLIARSFLIAALPNAPMADEEYMSKFSIELRHDAIVVASSSFSRLDLEEMKRFRVLCLFYLDERFAFYLALYLQVEHGIRAIDFVAAIMDASKNAPDKYPLIFSLHKEIIDFWYMGALSFSWNESIGLVFQKMDALWDEIEELIGSLFPVSLNPEEFSELVCLQKFAQPIPGRMKAGDSRNFKFNFIDYFAQFQPKKMPNFSSVPNNFKPLCEFKKSITLCLLDQPGLLRSTYKFQRDSMQDRLWSLTVGLPI